jgi:hypothetical protein
LLRSCPSGRLLPCVVPLNATAATVAEGYEQFATGLLRRERVALDGLAVAATPDGWPTDLGTDLYHLADIRVWLAGLRDDLTRLAAAAQDPTNLAAHDTAGRQLPTGNTAIGRG